MQRAGARLAVEVHKVSARHNAELREVQMRVQALKRVKRPRDLVEPHREHALTLDSLQVKASLKVSVLRFHREHVRMHRSASLFKGGKRVSEPDHASAFERAKHDAPCVLSCDKRGRGHNIEVIKSPRFLLEIFDGVMLSFTLDLADIEVFTVKIPFEHKR